jgi:hypothetical protein
MVTYSFTDMDPYFRSWNSFFSMESSFELWTVDAFGFLMGFHISIPPVGCMTRELVRG